MRQTDRESLIRGSWLVPYIPTVVASPSTDEVDGDAMAFDGRRRRR